ncbi:CoA ester lyase [Variovorax sp. UMC13]|uniref:HpcH/HpaI aldolase/citrate lyase family protein n=1 Tax=Variovorax sp. UMC13 TaxID=1862326 RepID=UPI0015FEF72D|nr:CoA ester lyase [Variovorax sp. UMC13]MBB1601814.1 hypothetical protein [Variovorax sp. UMC13]
MDLHRIRTALFVPVLEPRFFARAGERGADALILDLEDAIAPQRKAEARRALAPAVAALRATGLPLFARVNAEAELCEVDLVACVAAGVDAVMLPKVESPDTVQAARAALERHAQALGVAAPGALVALIETPRGVLRADAIAAADPGLRALGFGAEDYAAAMGRAPERELLLPAAARVAMCAAAEGLACWGLAASIAELDDLESLARAARLSRRLGFGGSPAVHPAQVPVLRRAFAPTDDELAHARDVLAAYAAAEADGSGALRLQGRMIDRPMVERARRLLA